MAMQLESNYIQSGLIIVRIFSISIICYYPTLIISIILSTFSKHIEFFQLG